MIIDFHTHGRLTKKAPYDPAFQIDMVRAAKEAGLTALVLSEHFNTTDYLGMFDRMAETFTYTADHYLIDGIRLYMGLEVDIAEGGHILLLRERDAIRAIRCALEPHTDEGHFIAFDDLASLAAQHDALMIGAHPFRGPDHLAHTLSDDQLRRFDAFDLNATDLFTRGESTNIRDLDALSARTGRPYVTGSDSHYPIQIGSNRTVFPDDPTDIDAIRSAIHEGRFHTQISDILPTRVFAARITKGHLKAQARAATS